jgi:DNA-binding transcriptional MocR family regulator
MSYKWDLSHLERGAASSITQQLVDHVAGLIDAGRLEPGEKLPPTRALAAAAGINHLTAARVYRRLAETGYVTAAVGRGTFVRTLPPVPDVADDAGDEWQGVVLPERPFSWASTAALEASFRYNDDPGVLSLAAGFPAPELIPADELAAVTADVFRRVGPEALAYLSGEGLPALRQELAERGRRSGFATDAEEIIVTSGARQGLELAARALLRPGDVAVVESPSFIGMVVSLQDTGARVLGVPVDEDGFDVDALERILARHEVKVVALQTLCQNPTGRDTSPERLERLAALARERSFFILEDGVYATLRYEGSDRPRLRSAAPGHVVYVDSLSKTVGGGLRLGWIAARGPVLSRLAALKTNADMATSTLVQEIVLGYLRSGAHEDLIMRATAEYQRRRDALCEALADQLSDEVTFGVPAGGHHVWVSLRRPVDERSLYFEALRAGVTYTPGSAATVEPPPRTSMRLSFGMLDPERLGEAVKRLAVGVRAARRAERGAASFPVS